jgi:predicted RNA-binding Zn-ribbon protein involved in translation (DUF1610 family)
MIEMIMCTGPKRHIYPREKQLNLGCPECFGDYLEAGGNLD